MMTKLLAFSRLGFQIYFLILLPLCMTGKKYVEYYMAVIQRGYICVYVYMYFNCIPLIESSIVLLNICVLLSFDDSHVAMPHVT